MANYYINDNRNFPPTSRVLPFIHITKEFDILKKIVIEGFRPNYCTEKISNNDREIIAAFPMISLANLSLEDSKDLLSSYGQCGIALKKNFVERHRFNPVLYLDRNSEITSNLVNSFDVIRDKYLGNRLFSSLFSGSTKSENVLFARNLLTQFAYSKNYDDQLIRSGKIIEENYTFGLEREWRLIHKDEKIDYFLIQDDIEKKSDYNSMLEDIRYEISLNEIEAILVETEYQAECLKTILNDKYKTETNVRIEINTKRHICDYD